MGLDSGREKLALEDIPLRVVNQRDVWGWTAVERHLRWRIYHYA